jgi:hypothetical protein
MHEIISLIDRKVAFFLELQNFIKDILFNFPFHLLNEQIEDNNSLMS